MINTENLTVYYGSHRGIEEVNLEVRQGEVFGFLGPNGAGKTTTERVLLDVLRPTAGKAFIFGLDCRKNGRDIRKRIGYLPGELKLYEHMTGSSYLKMIGSLDQKKPDGAYTEELCERLELDPRRKIKEYSRGNKQKIGVVAAFMGKPDLLILDEPTTGLDPLKQQVVIDLVREVKKEGRTVFLSSHILGEVQAVCDRVGIIREGRLIKTESVEALTSQQFKRLKIRTRKPVPEKAFTMEGVRELQRDPEGREITLEISDRLEEVLRRSLDFGLENLDTQAVTLEEVFLAYYGNGKNGGNIHG
ncbi:MAG: ABC transporter ATP-binding protein [Spirochaetales bacterium]|nr:ABC transporter ATP-binding protein [Spirochaetales bacterium]